MSSNELNRRDFNRLSMAAMGGVMAGAMNGCKPAVAPPAVTPPPAPITPATPPAVASTGEVAGKVEAHLCRGLNACKGQGGGASAGKNSCAGLGDCATVKEHACGEMNDCKGLGGCGKSAGANECKGKGGCHVPLMDDAWKQVRKRFEEKMKTDGKKFGEAPAKQKSA